MKLGPVTDKVNGKGELILTFDKSVFKDGAPDGFKDSYDYMQTFAEATQKEAVVLAVDSFKKDKKLQEVKVVAPFGTSAYDKIQVSVSREKLSRNLKTGEESMQPRMSVKLSSGIVGTKKALTEQKAKLKEVMANI